MLGLRIEVVAGISILEVVVKVGGAWVAVVEGAGVIVGESDVGGASVVALESLLGVHVLQLHVDVSTEMMVDAGASGAVIVTAGKGAVGASV